MAFNLYQLTNLSYDDAEPLIDQYIDDALQQFINSNAGKAYRKKYPTGGFWIGTFIEFAYLYAESTLPEMTKRDAQFVMEEILPRKLTLMDPEEANNAIPELIAFWTFIKDEYRLRSAGAIAKYLQSINGKFKAWVNDPARGGIAKNFMMAGMNSGIDMSSEAGIKEFQAIYNQRLQSNPPIQVPLGSKVPMVAPPPDVQDFLDFMGIDVPPEGELVDPMALMGQVLTSLTDFEDLMQMMDDSAPESLPQSPFPLGAMMMENISDQDAILSQEDINLLTSQSISDTSPGTILHDFEAVLNFIGTKGIPVSTKRQQLGGKYLEDLNQILTDSIDTGLSRPTQKSYPFVHGLYLLLRASRLVSFQPKGKKLYMSLNPEIYHPWQQLNPTERYFTLLEAWMIIGHMDLLGDESNFLTEGDRTLKTWGDGFGLKKQTYASYGVQERLSFWPGFHNLALMKLFGLITITTGKPTKGKGWRIKSTEPLPFGTAIMNLLRQTFVQQEMTWKTHTNQSLALQELQPIVSPYFPEWKHCLILPIRSFRPGQYIFKVTLGKIWRRISISADATLADLSDLILGSVEFDSDHLDSYTFKDEWGRIKEVMHPGADPDLSTADVAIGGLPLEEGSTMEYLFDFGEGWKFDVCLEQVESLPTSPGKKRQKKGLLGKVIETHGKSPEQYPDYDGY